MKRVDTSNKATDLFGSGKHGFQDYDPGINAGTTVDESWANQVQEEIAAPIEAGGYSIDDGSRNQLLGVLQMNDLRKSLSCFSRYAPVGSVEFRSVAGGVPADNQRAVAVGGSGTIETVDSTSQSVAAASAAGGYSGNFESVKYCGANFKYVICGQAEEIQTLTGTTATQRNTGGTDILRSIAYDPGNDRVVIVGANSTIWESTNPATWNDRSAGSALTATLLDRVVWADSLGLFIASSSDATDPGIMTSPDGITWTKRSSLETEDISWSESIGRAFAIAESDGSVYYSNDGITWTDTGDDADNSGLLSPVCLGGLIQRAFYLNQGTISISKFSSGDRLSFAAAFRDAAFDGGQINDHVYDPVARCYWVCGIDAAGAPILGRYPTEFGI